MAENKDTIKPSVWEHVLGESILVSLQKVLKNHGIVKDKDQQEEFLPLSVMVTELKSLCTMRFF